jgi:hypothetical protein
MDSSIRNAMGILGCAALVCLCVLLIDFARMAISAENAASAMGATATAANKAIADVSKQVTGKNGLIEEYRQVALQTRKEVDAVQQTTLAERTTIEKTGEAVLQTVNDLDAVARNGATVIQALGETITELGGSVSSLKADTDAAKPAIEALSTLISTVSDGAGKTFDGADKTLVDVDALVIAARPTVNHVDSMSGHLDDGSKSLAETLGFIRDDFSPKKRGFWLNLLDKATNGAVSAIVSIFLPGHVKVVNK